MENEFNLTNEVEFEENKTSTEEKKQRVKHKFKSESALFGFLFIFSIAFLVSLYFLNIFITPIKVVGASMQPTINAQITSDSDEEHCDIAYFRKHEIYSSGDIIIMSNPNKKYIDSLSINYLIKRVIACPGQIIRFIPDTTKNYPSALINSRIYYTIEVEDENGNIIFSDEDYIKDDMYFLNSQENFYKSYDNEGNLTNFGKIFVNLKLGINAELEIGEAEYFVMGDNRNNSTDSRIFGCVDKSDIEGRVELVVPYGESLFDSILEKLQII